MKFPQPLIGDDYCLPTAVLESQEDTELKELLAEVRDHLISLRVDLGPMADYFSSIMNAAKDQEAEASHLPIGFPAAAKLEKAGITAVADVPRRAAQLKRLGLTPEEATEVLAELFQGNNPL